MLNKYISCHYIENALIFHPRNLYHCCIPVNGRFGSTVICDFHGGDLPIDQIKYSRYQYRYKLQNIDNYPDLHCNGCIHIKIDNWDSKYLFTNIHFNNSLLCNLACNFCVQRSINVKQQRSDYNTLSVVKQLLENNIISPSAFIFWAGGEPTLLNDFEESLTLMYEYGTENEIATNATIFSEAIYRFLHPGGRLILKTSIDCGTRDSFLQMKGKDLFDTVWKNLSKYASTGGEVSAKYIISHDNITRRDLDGFINQMIKYKILWAHIDINHNFSKSEVTEHHILAAKYLYDNLLSLGINTDIGVHSLASIPDFCERVQEKSTITGENNNINYHSPKILIFARYIYDVLRCKVWLPEFCTQIVKLLLYTILDNSCVTKSDTKIKIQHFMQEADKYFRDVEPPQLSIKHLSNSSILPNREYLLEHLQIKNIVCAEIGTQTGYFAKKMW
jgi:hypothetical protein